MTKTLYPQTPSHAELRKSKVERNTANPTDRVQTGYEQNEMCNVASLALLAVTDLPFGSIATDFEQFIPQGRSLVTRGIVGEGRRR